jgi:hypothetical protein
VRYARLRTLGEREFGDAPRYRSGPVQRIMHLPAFCCIQVSADSMQGAVTSFALATYRAHESLQATQGRGCFRLPWYVGVRSALVALASPWAPELRC